MPLSRNPRVFMIWLSKFYCHATVGGFRVHAGKEMCKAFRYVCKRLSREHGSHCRTSTAVTVARARQSRSREHGSHCRGSTAVTVAQFYTRRSTGLNAQHEIKCINAVKSWRYRPSSARPRTSRSTSSSAFAAPAGPERKSSVTGSTIIMPGDSDGLSESTWSVQPNVGDPLTSRASHLCSSLLAPRSSLSVMKRAEPELSGSNAAPLEGLWHDRSHAAYE